MLLAVFVGGLPMGLVEVDEVEALLEEEDLAEEWLVRRCL